MQADEHGDDVRAIERLIARQFGSLTWTPETSADWDAFAADFFPEATLYPAARPAQRQSVEAFVERTKGLAGTKLRSFHETVLGTEVRVFGNVAVALAACEMAENNGTGEPGRRDAAPHQGCECMADRIAGLGYGEPVQANPQRNPQRSPGWAGWRVLEARLFDVSRARDA